MSLIYTMLFVYWLEDNRQYADRVRTILAGIEKRGHELCTSAFTVGELLVGPRKKNDSALAQRIREALREPHLRVLPFNEETADRYASILAAFAVSPADAIQLATAGQARVDLFLTNDRKLIGKPIPGIKFIAGLEVGLF
jgi:predicted nucleic acid-binding protein